MSVTHLNYHHLHLFWEVARSGSLRAAAEKLHLSQPTISTQIKALEESLGETLFDRSGRGLKVTTAGQLVMDRAGEIFSLGNDLLLGMRGHAGARRLHLHLGVVQSLPKLMAWQTIRPALEAFPNLQLSCTEGQAADLIGMLVSGRLDAVLMDEAAPASLRVKVFSRHLSESITNFCATPKLAKSLRKGFPQSLNGAPVLLPAERTPWRHQIDRWLEIRHIQPRIVAEFDDAALLKTAAADGLGFVPVLERVTRDASSRYGLAVVGPAAECRLSCYLLTLEPAARHAGLSALVAGAAGGVRGLPRRSRRA